MRVLSFLIACVCASAAQVLPGEPERIYSPKFPPGIATLGAARDSLSALLTRRTRPVGVRFEKAGPARVDFARKENRPALFELLKGGNEMYGYRQNAEHELEIILYINLTIRDDRIELSPRVAFPFSELLEDSIAVTGSKDSTFSYVIRLASGFSLHFSRLDLPDAQKVADLLYLIQKRFTAQDEGQAARAAALAAEYRALAVKPPVTEEQRRLIVQANLRNQQKDFESALDLYRQAVAVNPFSYPAAYFNMALLSAQLGRYRKAIVHMKQYLLFEPEAKDARSAQDKIYEWELM